MPISKIPGAGLDTGSGGVAPGNLTTGGPYWDGSGNVGIGTTSPLSTAMLEVSRSTTVIPTVTVTADNQVTGWRTRRTGGSYAYEYYMGIRENSTALDFYDNTANALRARIDSSGNFIFRYVTATAPWDQNSAGNGAYAWLGNSTYTLGACNQNNIVGIFNRYQGNGVVIEIKNGTAVVGSISHNGSNTAFNTSSDYRLKENVQPMTGALAKVAALKPCTYTWKPDGSAGEGFIAHELAEVCPGAVTGEKDALKEDGSINPQGIDTSFLVATLTAAIQEQQQMIETLQAKVAALEAK